ncbi:hypothetical protein [Streptomyces sp. NPDC087300]|uniref:hypothetical protein n=1 Tax=Streptomyces sp. NPDC087300 TaxID=3365780 RepID=UPI0038060F61
MASMIGCIGPEFDLDGKQLVVLGPVRKDRPASGGQSSGLYSDAAGMRLQTAPETVERVAQSGPSDEVVSIAAGESYRLPASPVVVANPYPDRPYLITGRWMVQWQVEVPQQHGTVWLRAEPARYASERPPVAFAFTAGSLTGTQEWGGSGVWPVTEVLNPAERLVLHLNGYLVNETPATVRLTFHHLVFTGLECPPASGHPIPTVGQVANKLTGQTIGEVAASHTGKTLADVVEEWST